MNHDQSDKGSVCSRCGTQLVGGELENGCPRCCFAMLFSPGPGMPPATPETRTPHRIGDYDLLEEIARGGMGIVFKARQISLNRIVAVKMIALGHLASPALVERFRTEAAAVANLDHPNIVPIYEVGEQDGHNYFSMRFVEGGTLAERILDRKSQISNRDAARLVATVAHAVHFAHQHGILHRDLKPGNILLDAKGEPYVVDFGLAKLLEAETNLTGTAAVMGTVGYMAPEQASGEGKQLTTAADLYSLGAILYELLTGKPPFKAGSVVETMRQVVEKSPDLPHALNPQVDRDLETICLKCLEKEPGHRYGSAEALAEDLESWLEGEPIKARANTGLERAIKWARRKPAIAALAGVSCLALLALIGVLTLERLRQTETELRREAQQALLRAEQALEAAAVQTRRADVESEKAMANFYIASIALADRGLRERDIVSAIRHLEECPAPLRNWEWHYLNRLCHRESQTLRAHITKVVAVGFAADGKRLASLDADGVLMAWDATGGSRYSDTRIWKHAINKAAFSADGSRLFTDGRNDEFVRVWDVISGTEILSIEPTGTNFSGSSVAISTKGELIAVASGNNQTIGVWSSLSKQMVRTLTEQTGVVNSMAFSPDLKHLAWATGQLSEFNRNGNEISEQAGGVWVSDLAAPDTPISLGKIETPVMAVAFSPDGRWLAAGRGDGTVVVWDLKITKLTNGIAPTKTLRGHTDAVLCLAFSANSPHLASGGSDRSVVIWDMVLNTAHRTFLGHSSAVTTLAFHPDGAFLASGSDDASVKVWEFASKSQPVIIEGSSSGLAFSTDSTLLTSGGSIWSAQDGTLISGAGVKALRQGRPAFSPDGKSVASGKDISDSKFQSLVAGEFRVYGVSFNVTVHG